MLAVLFVKFRTTSLCGAKEKEKLIFSIKNLVIDCPGLYSNFHLKFAITFLSIDATWPNVFRFPDYN